MTLASRPVLPADQASLLGAATAGDADAFRQLAAPHRRELLVHCYRMLGSFDDAEDAVQETLLKAWRKLPGFQGRSSLRAWLYRIATNTCLDALDHQARRVLPAAITGPADPARPPAADDLEMAWLQPYPDSLLDEITDPDPLTDPAAAAEQRQHIELAFIAAIQYLPPRQRAVLLMRDVLGWPAAETAGMLGMSAAAVNSALQRARTILDNRLPQDFADRTALAEQAELIGKYVRAWHAADIGTLVALLREDAIMSMPPTPSWYHGRDHIAIYLRQLFTNPWGRSLRLMPTAANRQPALAVYAPVASSPVKFEPFALKVFTVHNGQISAVTGFVSPHLFGAFGLPAHLDLDSGTEATASQ